MRFCGKTGNCYLANGHLGPCQPYVPPRSFSDTSDPDPVHTAARAAAQRDQRRWEAACAALTGLMANAERYAYISSKVKSGELSQAEATAKNANKAVFLGDALLAAFEEPKP